jgi:hypothetical protein
MAWLIPANPIQLDDTIVIDRAKDAPPKDNVDDATIKCFGEIM